MVQEDGVGLVAEAEALVASRFSGARLDHPLHGVVIAGCCCIQIYAGRTDPTVPIRAYESLFSPDDLIFVVDRGEVAGRRARYLTGDYDEYSRRLSYTSAWGGDFAVLQQTFFRTRARNLAHETLLADAVTGGLLDGPYVLHSERAVIATSLGPFLSFYACASAALEPLREAVSDYIFQDGRTPG